tara:strand:- start:337 stop:1158 length:822 start_codon:yes stop_codon:yes gene_type:complete
MSKPSTRQELIDYSLRRLGYPVLEINVDDDQIDDLVDDAIQHWQDYHFDGYQRMFLKHKITSAEKDILKDNKVTTTVSNPSSTGVQSVGWDEGVNYLQLPDHIIGINKVFKMDNSTISSGLFNIKYQLFLNDVYYYGALDLLNYSMTKTYLEDLSRLITPDTQLRFNRKNSRLYLDIDWDGFAADDYVVLDCYRLLDPADSASVYNDWWLKKYLTSLIKRQWGQNLIKFQGVALPGGVQLNGRQLYDDAVAELQVLEQELRETYEEPPFDLIG